MNVRELYCLNDDRHNFSTIEGQDDDKIFGDKTLKELLERTLKEAQVSHKPPRAVILGQNGLGKTQHLAYLESKINKDNLPFHVVRFKVGSYEAKSRMNLLHNRMLSAFGSSLFAEKVSQQIKADQSWLGKQRVPENVAHAFHEMAMSPKATVRESAQRFLSGEQLKASDLAVTKPALNEGEDYASVIKVLAEVIKVQDNKILLFFLDETEYFQYVNNQDAYINWRDGLRNLLDVKQAGFIFAVAAQNMESIAKVMREPDIVRRVATNNYHKLPGYTPSHTQDFFRELLANFIDQDKLAKLEKDKGLASIPGYSRQTFPFTKDALEGYCRWIHKKDSEAKPSEFQDRIDETTADACIKGVQVIDAQFLKARGEFRDED